MPGRCAVCNKKLGLLGGFRCLCDLDFCAAHRAAEVHGCTFDHAAHAKARSQLSPVRSDKVPNRIGESNNAPHNTP